MVQDLRPDARSSSPTPSEPIGILLLLKAFAGGSVALTGIEAIANGVPAFKPPEARNAANTMTAMADPAGHPVHRPDVVRRPLTACARPTARRRRRSSPWPPRRRSATVAPVRTFASGTALILFLAANTSFNAFPRLAAILAEDGYMPRQFSFRGDRLAYSWGIVLLAARRVRPAVGVRWRHPRPDPALLGRRVRVLHAQPDRDGQALARGPRVRAGAGACAINALGARPDRGRRSSSSSPRSSATAPTWSSSSCRCSSR